MRSMTRPETPPQLSRLALVLCATSLACSGSIGEAPTAAGSPSAGAPPAGSPPTMPNDTRPGQPAAPATEPTASNTPPAATLDLTCPPKAPATGPRARRLSPIEYTKLVTQLLHGRTGAGPLPTGFKPPVGDLADAIDRYSRFASGATIAETSSSDVLEVSSSIGNAYATSLEAAPDSCLKAGTPFADCARKTIRAAGEVLFRRPVDAEQEQLFLALAQGALPEKGPRGALAVTISVMLASPATLFHLEIGRAPTGLDAYEMADAIASLLSEAPPDEPLWQAAKANQLSTADQIRPHVQRLLGDFSKAPPQLMVFVRELFGYERALNVFKDEKFHDAEGLIRDTDALVAQLLARHGRAGFFESLFSTTTVLASATTVESYGLAPKSLTGSQPQVITPPGPRLGLFTQPSFLVANSENAATAPVKRGEFIREEVLCQHVPSIPIGLVPVLPERPLTAREKLAIHNEKPECLACHKLMDDFGLAFEIYDHLGRYRTMEHGKPIDATGVLDLSGDQDGPFRDAVELVERLGKSSMVKQCMARQLFRWVAGRNDQEADGCAVSRVLEAYNRSNGDVSEAVVAAIASETFRMRKAAAP